MLEKFQGCLVGCAVGDALGQPIEFLLKDATKITNHLLADKFRQFKLLLQEKYHGTLDAMVKNPLRPFKNGEYTDDTDQTLLLVDSLIEKRLDPEDFSTRLVEWFDGVGKKGCGTTTAKVLTAIKQGVSWAQAGKIAYRDGAPPANGSIMRTAPIGLYFAGQPDEIDHAAAVISEITHAHPEAIAACQMTSQMVAKLVEGSNKLEALSFIRERYPISYRTMLETNVLRYPGGALATLKISIDAFLTTYTFYDAVIRAINRTGDSDSYGAVTGVFAGTFYGRRNIPRIWQGKLNPLTADQIAEKAKRLFLARQ